MNNRLTTAGVVQGMAEALFKSVTNKPKGKEHHPRINEVRRELSKHGIKCEYWGVDSLYIEIKVLRDPLHVRDGFIISVEENSLAQGRKFVYFHIQNPLKNYSLKLFSGNPANLLKSLARFNFLHESELCFTNQ